MSNTYINLENWKPCHLKELTNLLNMIKKEQFSKKFAETFDFKSLKIDFNTDSGYVYLSDDDFNCGMDVGSDGLIHLVDEWGNPTDEEEEKADEKEETQIQSN
jgi:hypothetical protein